MKPSMLELLRSACADVPISEAALASLVTHWELLKLWNARMNLTAITDDAEAALLHYRDSLELLRHLPEAPQRVVDLGSGAGFPGIPIAVATAHRVTLLEPRAKRVSFLKTASARLGLRNLEVLHGRTEDAPPERFDLAVTRATFGSEASVADASRWLEPGGKILALRAEGPSPFTAVARYPYELAGKRRMVEVLA